MRSSCTVALTSPDNSRDSLYLSNYATISLKDELSRLPGVGNVNVFGAGQYAMRVWLDPDKMQARGLTTQDVANALGQQSQDVTAGLVGAPPAPPGQDFQYTLNVAGRLDQVEQFEDVILKTGAGGATTRLRDVARIELGAETYGIAALVGDYPGAGLAISLSPGADALSTAQGIKDEIAAQSKNFPPGYTVAYPSDSTVFIKRSCGIVSK